MIVVENKVVSSGVEEEHFVCDLAKCKGACCVEGDLGAPLEEDELDKVEEAVEMVKEYLPKESLEVLEKEGGYILDEEGDFSTTTINGRECVFAYRDEKDILKCSIEQAWKDGKTDFRKPVSCHLYPIRITKLHGYDALNYDQWEICSPACDLGEQLKVPVYKFLEEALVRKYGREWFDKLEKAVEGKEKSS